MRYRSRLRQGVLALQNPHQLASRLFLAKGTTVFATSEMETPESFSSEYYILALNCERERVVRFFTLSHPLKLLLLPFIVLSAPFILLRLAITNEIVRSHIYENTLAQRVTSIHPSAHENIRH